MCPQAQCTIVLSPVFGATRNHLFFPVLILCLDLSTALGPNLSNFTSCEWNNNSHNYVVLSNLWTSSLHASHYTNLNSDCRFVLVSWFIASEQISRFWKLTVLFRTTGQYFCRRDRLASCFLATAKPHTSPRPAVVLLCFTLMSINSRALHLFFLGICFVDLWQNIVSSIFLTRKWLMSSLSPV